MKVSIVVIPDFSKNKVEWEILTKQFDNMKAFMKENDLLKKSKIVDSFFFETFPPIAIGGIICPQFKKSFLFINILRASVQFRLFENGRRLCCSICSDFGYEFPANFHSIILSWNDRPMGQPLACATGEYIQRIGRCLNPNDVGNYWYPELIAQLKNGQLASIYYFSWGY